MPKENFEKPEMRKNNHQNSENKIFEKRKGTFVEKFTADHPCM